VNGTQQDGSPPTAVVGMVGAGQLARMTQQAAIALGIELRVLSKDRDSPAVDAGARHVAGDPCDMKSLLRLAEGCDVVTFDHEGVPPALISRLAAAGHQVRPSPAAQLLAQDKGEARRLLSRSGFPVPPFIEVAQGDVEAVRSFAAAHGWPLVLKAPTGGYDGRGVEVITSAEQLASSPLAAASTRWLIEEKVDIRQELAVLIARRPAGWWQAYPVVETVQRDGICHELQMPGVIPAALAVEAVSLAASIADGIDATGILAVELFVTGDGGLVVNELAARPHNSGHATIEATVTSQFENHLRAVLDWPLGDTSLLAPAVVTVNLLGPVGGVDLARGLPAALEDPSIHVHLYRKAHRAGRKLGHVTALAETVGEAQAKARRAAACLVAP